MVWSRCGTRFEQTVKLGGGGGSYFLWTMHCPHPLTLWRCRGIVEWPLDSHAEGPSSIPAFARYFCPSARHFIHIAALDPGVKWGPGRMRTELWLSWHVRAYKTATGRNAPQGVEKVHFECRIVSESYDRGNNTLWSALIIIWKSAI